MRVARPNGGSFTRLGKAPGCAPTAPVCRAWPSVNPAGPKRGYRHGLCVRCALEERVQEVAGASDGPLAVIYEAVASAQQPYSAHNWLGSHASAAMLADVASGRINLAHEALDAHPEARAAEYLRHILVSYGLLPARDEAIARLEAWLSARLDEIGPPETVQLLRSYAN